MTSSLPATLLAATIGARPDEQHEVFEPPPHPPHRLDTATPEATHREPDLHDRPDDGHARRDQTTLRDRPIRPKHQPARSRIVALSFPIQPMTATLGSLPAADVDDRWAYEIKYDGYRTLAFVEDGAVRLQSRRGHDVTGTYPELGALAASVNAGVSVLDGELCVLDDEGRPRFELIQRHDREAALFVFDVLRVDAHDTIGLPYEDRRRLLDQLVEPGDNWAVAAWTVGGGSDLLAATGEQGLEGVMAKRLGSAYVPGKRTPNWLKVKHRRRTEVVIGGFTTGDRNRASTFGSLLVGRRDGEALAFAGGVGTGFDAASLASLAARMRGLVTGACPFDPAPPRAYHRGANWIEPILSATIEMTEFTDQGYVRQASFIELHDPEAHT